MCFRVFAFKFCLSDPESSNFTIPALLLTLDLLCLLFIYLYYILLKSHTFKQGILQCWVLKNLIFKVHACIHCVLISISPFVLLQFLPFSIPSFFFSRLSGFALPPLSHSYTLINAGSLYRSREPSVGTEVPLRTTSLKISDGPCSPRSCEFMCETLLSCPTDADSL